MWNKNLTKDYIFFTQPNVDIVAINRKKKVTSSKGNEFYIQPDVYTVPLNRSETTANTLNCAQANTD